MRKLITISTTVFMFVALALVPGTAPATNHRVRAADANHDRIPDRWEKRNHLSLNVKQTRRDQDHDGLNNLGEFRTGTNPHDADTDNDGIHDGAEIECDGGSGEHSDSGDGSGDHQSSGDGSGDNNGAGNGDASGDNDEGSGDNNDEDDGNCTTDD